MAVEGAVESKAIAQKLTNLQLKGGPYDLEAQDNENLLSPKETQDSITESSLRYVDVDCSLLMNIN